MYKGKIIFMKSLELRCYVIASIHHSSYPYVMWSIYSPASALETVGLETITGVTLGAFVIAPRCTIPIRPQPMTPTLISLTPESFSFGLIEVFTNIRLLVLTIGFEAAFFACNWKGEALILLVEMLNASTELILLLSERVDSIAAMLIANFIIAYVWFMLQQSVVAPVDISVEWEVERSRLMISLSAFI
jgi:hypothetical protein